ncbi:uncharacterized protein FYW35_003872 [Pterocles gutturalis]
MEAPNLLENGNIPQKRKFSSCQVTFYTSIFVLIIISALVSVVICLLHQKQLTLLLSTISADNISINSLVRESSTPNSKDALSWEWKLEHCEGFVQKDQDQYLIIEQNGNYFIYAQVNRREEMNQSFSLFLYKEPEIPLNKAVGPNTGDKKGTVNFGRPFFLQKGDKLYCQGNFPLDYIVAGNQTYWGLYKI